MKYLSLSGTWTLFSSESPDAKHEGTVPGSVYSILLADGSMEDPFYRMNEKKSLDLMKQDWTFTRGFTVDKDFLSCPEIELTCEGLDTICTLFINGKEVGKAFNMFRRWVYPVKSVLREGENEIAVLVSSPVKYIKEKDAVRHVGGTTDAMRGFTHMRKPHCMFGWDWGPRLPDGGIWKEIGLTGVDTARFTDVRVVQEHTEGRVLVRVTAEKEGDGDVKCYLIDPDGKRIDETSPGIIEVCSPRLWWPSGLGEQPLYRLTVELLSGGHIVDRTEKNIGLRTMTLVRRKDEQGEGFCHCVNGVEFFAMGADYIPEDNIFSRITEKRTRKLLLECKRANFNALRVWGGGYYPPDSFYDECDRLGIVVWQDMMFACANYPLDYDFEDNITNEIRENVRRIRHHASLALWCGNNEMEEFEIVGAYESGLKDRAVYIRMFEHIIPHILHEEDPFTPYWPSSPSSGGSYDNPTDPTRGDVHFWKVWHSRMPFSEYRKHQFRYVSEFGFESFPCMSSVRKFTAPEDWNIFSRVMETHQRSVGANGLIISYLAQSFLYPTSFPVLLYASQVLQAEAIKTGVEYWRSHRGMCMGAIYWQLNDIWPVASWSSIDYYGMWKALHYYARRFFEPVHISCEEYGESQEYETVIAEPHGDVKCSARLNVTNETRGEVRGAVRWELRDNGDKVVRTGSRDAIVPSLSAVDVEMLDFGVIDFLKYHLYYEFVKDGAAVSSGTVIFTAPKYYHWKDPALSVTRRGDELVIRADAYAKSIEVYSDDGVFLLSDNFFDLEKGEKTVKIIEEKGVADYKVRSVYDIK